jgi:hypothetical protein
MSTIILHALGEYIYIYEYITHQALYVHTVRLVWLTFESKWLTIIPCILFCKQKLQCKWLE